MQANVEPPYRRQLDAYICLDRLAEAKQLAEKLRAQGLGGARIHQRFLEIAYVEGDDAAAAREIQWFAGKPVEYLSFGLQAANRNALGQRRESSKLYQRAAETARRHGLRNVAAEFEEADARADALSGNCQTVRRLGRPALALAMCGDAAQAEKLAEETSKLFPNGTLWNAVQLPAIRAAIALKRDQPAKAVELLASASPYERAYPDAVYLRGLAYLGLHKGAEAAAEFREDRGSQRRQLGQYLATTPIGDSSIRFPTWGWRAAPCSLATRRKPEKRFRSSSHSGKTPTRTSPSCSKPRRNTRSCNNSTKKCKCTALADQSRSLDPFDCGEPGRCAVVSWNLV